MSVIKNPNTTEGKVHQIFCLLSSKYGVDVEKIADIICDYHELLEKNIKTKYVRKLRSKTKHYGRIIEVDAPVRFYWGWDGEYDGFEFGEFEDGLSRYESRLLDEVFKVMEIGMSSKRNPHSGDDIPEVIGKEFGERL